MPSADAAGSRRTPRKGIGHSPAPKPLRLGSHGRAGVAIELLQVGTGGPNAEPLAGLAVNDGAAAVPISRRAAGRMADWLREFSRTGDRLPELIGLRGIIDRHGITYRTLRKWRTHPLFPEPACEIEGRPVYVAERVDLWVERDRPKPGRPPQKR